MNATSGFDPETGAWNDSLAGDYLWSRNNFGEARPDVMTPFTYSLTEKVWSAISFLPGYHLSGNICGRYYANISVSISMLFALGRSRKAALEQIQDLLGSVPADLDIPTVPLPRLTMLLALPRMIRLGLTARLREAARDEITRSLWVEREWALRAGELTDLGDDVFLLTIDEVLALLTGKDVATSFIPARQKTYAGYRALPPYPMIIRGPFDPSKWVADPNRRNDIYDATDTVHVSTAGTISGFAGAAGRIEGRVRILDGPEQGNQLQPDEILVAVTTNVGWTPLFPRAAAVVTDVGAPLSHAAIVARELGIPAVVGCGSATTRLHMGDLVRVDGGQGTVEILGNGHSVKE